MTVFGDLNPDGSLRNVRVIPMSAMGACPHFIMVPEHYRTDNTCRCNDAAHAEMAEWGYEWDVAHQRWLNMGTAEEES